MTVSNLDAIKNSLAKSTQGTWRSQDHGTSVVRPYSNEVAISGESFDTVASLRPYDDGSTNPDAMFIAQAHNLMPLLITAAEALQRVLNEAEAVSNGTTWPFARLICDKLNEVNNDIVATSFSVNLYAYATAKVMADTHENAAKLIINSRMAIDNLSSPQYQATWSDNDCMMVDVNKDDSPEDTDEFDYASLVETSYFSIKPDQAHTLFEVNFYFNIQLEVNDAEDEVEAISKAKEAMIYGDLSIAYPVISIDYEISESLEPSIKGFDD